MIKTPLSTVIGGAFWTPGATVIGGNTLTFDQQIQKLFANNEQGFFYDPNDLSTMYLYAAGTVPVTGVGQPVGLILDKSKGLVLGGELVINGSFDTDTAWNKNTGVSISSGIVNISTTASGHAISQATAVPANKIYKVTYTINSYSSGGLRCNVGGTVGIIRNSDGTFTEYVRAFGYSTLQLVTTSGFVGSVDNFSVKEVLGNHAFQTNSAARPILQDIPRRIDFDAVDDKLITNLPTQLTGCTVIRSVPNVGTQILTGQTIPATYEDNTDHCGLIVINRALTPSETSAITTEFNKRAGV